MLSDTYNLEWYLKDLSQESQVILLWVQYQRQRLVVLDREIQLSPMQIG